MAATSQCDSCRCVQGCPSSVTKMGPHARLPIFFPILQLPWVLALLELHPTIYTNLCGDSSEPP